MSNESTSICCSFDLVRCMEELKKILLLVLGCAVQVGLGQGWKGPALGHLVCGFVGINSTLVSEAGGTLPLVQHDRSQLPERRDHSLGGS